MANISTSVSIPEGFELLPGLTKENAEIAFRFAEDRGFAQESVQTSSALNGFLIPLGDTVQTAEAEEIVFPKAKTSSHDDIDAFAAEHDVTYDGIEAANAEKPTKDEKVAHIEKIVTERAEANSTALENGEPAGGLEPQNSGEPAGDSTAAEGGTDPKGD
jgi:hypothetical protein